MTRHVSYSHQCPSCEAYYIPYDSDVPCPQCGIIEPERYNFIPLAIESSLTNLAVEGSYVPGAWYMRSLADHILRILFDLLERERENSSGISFNDIVEEELQRKDWGEQVYLRQHIHGIALRVYDEIQRKMADKRQPCPVCGVIPILGDRYCRRCGTALSFWVP
jgi:hypothetical protein